MESVLQKIIWSFNLCILTENKIASSWIYFNLLKIEYAGNIAELQ